MIADQNANVHGKHSVVHGKKSWFISRGEIMLVVFSVDKETKNTVRFTAPIGNEISGSIYVQKDSELADRTEIVVEVVKKVEATA